MEANLAKVWELLEDAAASSEEFIRALMIMTEYYIEEEIEREQHRELLTRAFELDRAEFFVAIVDVLKTTNSQESLYPTISYILTLPLDRDCVKYYGEHCEVIFFEAVEGLFNVSAPDQLSTALQAIDLIFEDQTKESDIYQLIEAAREQDVNEVLMDYLEHKRYTLSTQTTETPEWIVPAELIVKHGRILTSHDMLVKALSEIAVSNYVSTDPEADVNYILERRYVNPKATNQDPEIFREEILYRFGRMSNADRTAYVRWLEDNTRNMLLFVDAELFGVWGPCCMQPGAINLNDRSRDICRTKGGCRMFYCYENENRDPITGAALIPDVVANQRYAELNWFKGKCQVCARIIAYMHHAVRKPLAIGGWIGCYCSFDCIRKDIDEGDIVGLRLANKYDELIDQVGIYDRTY